MISEITNHNQQTRVAAYCRVSTDKDDQINSLNSQRRYFEEYIMQHENWQLVNIYYDEGISGTQTKRRAGFNAMIEAAMKGKLDLILTKEVSRFARNTVDTLSYTRSLKAKGVGVLFTIDNIDTRDSDGELRLTIMASIAQEESRKTSQRVKWGQKRRMEQGVVFGRDLLGYKVKNGKLFVKDDEVPIVNAIFHKYTNEGKGAYAIARELSLQGMAPLYVREWSAGVILKILRNEKYVGDLCQKKSFTPDYLTHEKRRNRGNEKMIYIENHHEPIIDRDLWNRTQEELKMREPKEKYKHSSRYWCSGKIYCGLCGARYVSHTKKLKDGSIYKAWRCQESAKHGIRKVSENGEAVGCDNCSVNEKALLTSMKYCIGQLQIDRQVLKKELLKEIKSVQGIKEDKACRIYDEKSINARLDKLTEKKQRIIDMMLEGVITKEELHAQKQYYNEQILELSKQLSDYKDSLDKKETTSDLEEQIKSALDEILSFDEKNTILYQELLDRMIVKPDNTVEVWLKNISYGMKLTINSYGKKERYITDITDMEIINVPDCNSHLG